MSNTGSSDLTGDVGTNSGSITNFGTPTIVSGHIYTSNSLSAQAAIDVSSVYDELYNTTATNTSHLPAFGSGETIAAGVYAQGAAGSVAGNLILDAEGNSNAIFIFKFGGAFTTGAGSTITLANGALAGNVFWVADGAISMAASTTMEGILVANGANSMGAGGVLHGRMFSKAGAVSVNTTTAALVPEEQGGGMVSPNQTICPSTQPANLILTGHNGTVVKW